MAIDSKEVAATGYTLYTPMRPLGLLWGFLKPYSKPQQSSDHHTKTPRRLPMWGHLRWQAGHGHFPFEDRNMPMLVFWFDRNVFLLRIKRWTGEIKKSAIHSRHSRICIIVCCWTWQLVIILLGILGSSSQNLIKPWSQRFVPTSA